MTATEAATPQDDSHTMQWALAVMLLLIASGAVWQARKGKLR